MTDHFAFGFYYHIYPQLTDSNSGYSLVFRPDYPEGHFARLSFLAPYSGDVFMGHTIQPVTGFDLSELPKAFKEGIEPTDQVVDVGCGLGEITTYLSNRKGAPPVVAIDLANYNIIERLLNYATTVKSFDSVNERISIFLERLTELRTSKEINFLNMSLGQALEQHPEICGIADIVIDHGGAIVYPYNEPEALKAGTNLEPFKPIVELERRLLKPEGTIFTVSGKQLLTYSK